MKIITIKVTEKHIAKGIRVHGDKCPVALAIKEKLKIERLCVYSYGANINGNAVRFPRAAALFVNRFDSGKSVKPFSFKLKLNP